MDRRFIYQYICPCSMSMSEWDSEISLYREDESKRQKAICLNLCHDVRCCLAPTTDDCCRKNQYVDLYIYLCVLTAFVRSLVGIFRRIMIITHGKWWSTRRKMDIRIHSAQSVAGK